MNRTVLHGLLSPLCGMLRRAATGIGALKIAIWPVLVLGGDRARANHNSSTVSREPVRRWGIGIQAGYGMGLPNGQVKAFPYIVGGLAVAVGDGIRKKDNPDELSLLVAERGLEPLTSGL